MTHNRRVLLSRCLDHIERQSRPPDGIVVVNNGSTDDTESMLHERGIRCITQENLGSAGGWHRGIECALDKGYDAVWLMDDDGFPDATALGLLESELTPGVACVSSAVLCENTPGRLVFPLPRLDGRGRPVLFGLPRKLPSLEEAGRHCEDGLYPFAHFFNGALIATNAIRKAGNVDLGFFISGDEVDYLHRLRAVGRVYTLLSARHYHPDVSGRPLTDAKIYYYVKNTLIINRRYLDWVALRGMLTVAAAISRTARRNGLRTALSYLLGAKRNILWTAVARGLRGRVAKDFSG